MRLVPVFLVLCLVTVDAGLLDLFSKKVPIRKFDLGSAVQKIGQVFAGNFNPSKFLQELIPKPKQLEASESSNKSPKFCGKYECPLFYEEELNKTSDYKLRCYSKSYKWVTTRYDGTSSKRESFMRLFKYISGSNMAGMKMDMTVPVAMQIKLRSQSMSYQTMSFFIPFEHQLDAPSPTDRNVNLEIAEPFCAYVKVYGGYSSLSQVRENYQTLVEALKEDGRGDDISSDGIYSAGYDSPMKFWKRHNEIWIVSINHKPKSENRSILESPTKSTPIISVDEPPVVEKAPEFCDGHDCPSFYEEDLNATDFKLRCYPMSYKWVSTSVTNMYPKAAGRTAFWRLFRYIQGSNAEQMKIDMTVPVTMKMQPLQSGSGSQFVEKNYTMSFFIPFKHQEDAPAPSADNVMLTDVEPFCAYVKEYGGFSDMTKVARHYKELVASLKKHNLEDDFYTNMFYTAGYDSPSRLFKRHNEIWLVSKSRNPVNELLESRILSQ
ncbi:uncharacterized protein [Montipora capricornis]|uniref:uncharacterized protein n=1 Tax=Montipora capricornis TaxID=246305 RepID=UPI0035F1567D